MNNLHRELAPISDAAWGQIDEEATRSLKRYLAARRVVDVPEPKGFALAAVGTGHVETLAGPGDGIQAARRAANALEPGLADKASSHLARAKVRSTIVGLRNRLAVALNWLSIYVSGQRSARLILQDQASMVPRRRSGAA